MLRNSLKICLHLGWMIISLTVCEPTATYADWKKPDCNLGNWTMKVQPPLFLNHTCDLSGGFLGEVPSDWRTSRPVNQSADSKINSDDDHYWQYYSDCDRWGIVFTDLRRAGSDNHISAAKFSKWIEFASTETHCRVQRWLQWGRIAKEPVLEVLKQIGAESRRLELETLASSAATKAEQKQMRLIHSHGRTGMVLLQTSTRITSNVVQQYDLQNRIADQLDWLGQSCLSWSQRLRK